MPSSSTLPDFEPPIDDARRELAHDLVRSSYVRGNFLLSAGNRSTYYFDKYLFATNPSILRRLGRLLGELIPGDVDRLVAPERGAVLLGGAVALQLGLPLVLLPKTDIYSSQVQRSFAGELHPGERVAVIEDVVITGRQALRAVRLLRSLGATVSAVVAVLDRDGGAEAALRQVGTRYYPLFSVHDLPLE
jgi:orotate phosphoribosyltransferase